MENKRNPFESEGDYFPSPFENSLESQHANRKNFPSGIHVTIRKLLVVETLLDKHYPEASN
jgi:hypothetical protein